MFLKKVVETNSTILFMEIKGFNLWKNKMPNEFSRDLCYKHRYLKLSVAGYLIASNC